MLTLTRPSIPFRERGTRWLRHLLAIVLAAAVVLPTVLLPALHDRPYLLPFGGVAVAAWRLGYQPALLTAALALVGVNALVPALGQLDSVTFATGALFAAISSLIAFAARAMAQSESDARRDNARLEATFGQAAIGIVQLTLAGELARANARLAAIVGRTPGEIVGLRFDALAHPGDGPWLRERIAELASGIRDELSSDLRLNRADGATVWAHVSLSTLFDAQGHTEALLAVVADVDERHRAQERARLSEERARLALDVAELGTWSWEPDSSVVQADRRTREVCGLPRSAPLVLDDISSRIHTDDWPAVQETLSRALERDEIWACEFRVVHADGSLRWTVSRGKAVARADESSAPRVMLGTVLDVTASRVAEEALRRADRDKDDFLALLSHELRNPLAPIRTAVHLLRLRHPPDSDHQRLHAVIERQVQHLVRLVDDLLDVSRVMRGKIELRAEAVDISTVVGLAAETVRPTLDAQRQPLRLGLPDAPLYVRGDQVRLTQVVGNLLHNASKFSPRGSPLAIDVQTDDGEVTIRVCDQGAGISPELLPRIFDPFVQADRTLERSQGGLGIGLTLVRQIVGLHGGTVAAQSPGPGAGSEFVIRLPSVNAEPVAAVPEVGTMSAPPVGLHVLVVDDNVDAADSLAALLHTRGLRTSVAYDGRAALERALELRPDVVLLDIGLPGLNGYEVAAALRRQAHRPTALMAVTGYGQDADAERARQAGFDRHLVKPVDPLQLERVLSEIALRTGPAQDDVRLGSVRAPSEARPSG